MGSQIDKHWMVMVHRKMRGPLKAQEIHFLLEKGVIRRNDVACEIDLENKSKVSDWKLLWQFEEFDRRKNQDEQAGLPPEEIDRRKTKGEEFAKKTLAEIPQDLLEIDVSELVLSKNNNFNPDTLDEASRLASLQNDPSITELPRRNPYKLYGGLGLILLLIIGFQLFTPTEIQKTATPLDAVNLEDRLPASSPTSRKTRGNFKKPAPSLLLPSEMEGRRDRDPEPEAVAEEQEEPVPTPRRAKRKAKPAANPDEATETDEVNENLTDKGEIQEEELTPKKKTRKPTSSEEFAEEAFPEDSENAFKTMDADEAPEDESDQFSE